MIGGTLFIGRPLVERLLQDGHEVTVMHRRAGHGFGEAVQDLVADRNDAESVKSAIEGRTFDAVFDNVYDWERGTTAEQVRSTALLFAGLRRYIFISSVAAYGDGSDAVRVESDALAVNSADTYQRNKAESEEVLFTLYREQGLPVVTFRPPFIYGPGNPFYREAFVWERMRDGKPVIVPDDGSRQMQFVYVHDLVEAMVRSLTMEAAVGEAFNVGNAPVSQMAAVAAMGAVTGAPYQVVTLPRKYLEARGGSAMGPQLYFGHYFDLAPIPMLTEKTPRVLGVTATPFDAGLRATYEWWRQQPETAPDYEWEERVLMELR